MARLATQQVQSGLAIPVPGDRTRKWPEQEETVYVTFQEGAGRRKVTVALVSCHRHLLRK